MSDQLQKALDKGSLVSRIEDSICWARGRMCRPCRSGEQVCPACVRAQETVELLGELAVDHATKVVVSSPVVVTVEVGPKKLGACEACASGELLFDNERCEVCCADRADRKLKGAKNRFWDKK